MVGGSNRRFNFNRFRLGLFGQSVIYKSRGDSVKKWFWWGTLSLIVINAGICVFGDAVKTRTVYEIQKINKINDQTFSK